MRRKRNRYRRRPRERSGIERLDCNNVYRGIRESINCGHTATIWHLHGGTLERAAGRRGAPDTEVPVVVVSR